MDDVYDLAVKVMFVTGVVAVIGLLAVVVCFCYRACLWLLA